MKGPHRFACMLPQSYVGIVSVLIPSTQTACVKSTKKKKTKPKTKESQQLQCQFNSSRH